MGGMGGLPQGPGSLREQAMGMGQGGYSAYGGFGARPYQPQWAGSYVQPPQQQQAPPAPPPAAAAAPPPKPPSTWDPAFPEEAVPAWNAANPTMLAQFINNMWQYQDPAGGWGNVPRTKAEMDRVMAERQNAANAAWYTPWQGSGG